MGDYLERWMVHVRVYHAVLSVPIMLAALTGRRRGELFGIRWSDVDRDEMVLRVERAVKREEVGCQLQVGLTKTHQNRRVSLDPVAIVVLDTNVLDPHDLPAPLVRDLNRPSPRRSGHLPHERNHRARCQPANSHPKPPQPDLSPQVAAL